MLRTAFREVAETASKLNCGFGNEITLFERLREFVISPKTGEARCGSFR